MKIKEELAHRMSKLKPSGIRKIFEIASKREDIINLSIGEPDFDVPAELKNEAIKAIQEGFNKYTPTWGISELRDKVAENLTRKGVRYEELLITAGATGGLFLSILSLVDRGDEVLVPDPYFVAYGNIVRIAGGIPRFVNTYPDFKLCVNELEKQWTPQTKALMINSPNNPTGVVYSPDELKTIVEFAESRNLHIISDEVYDIFLYNDEPYTSVGQLTDSAIVINSFSKSAAMTGWRLGYVSGPAKIIEAMSILQQYGYASTNSIAQRAATLAFDVDLSQQVANYKKKRDLAYELLRQRFSVVQPQGAFYIFPKAPNEEADKFVEKAIEQGVLIIPGKTFSQRNTHFRISFAADEKDLSRGLEILNGLVD